MTHVNYTKCSELNKCDIENFSIENFQDDTIRAISNRDRYFEIDRSIIDRVFNTIIFYIIIEPLSTFNIFQYFIEMYRNFDKI